MHSSMPVTLSRQLPVMYQFGFDEYDVLDGGHPRTALCPYVQIALIS